MGSLVRESNLLSFALVSRMKMSEGTGIIICIAIRVLMDKVCPLGSLVLTFLTGLPGNGSWRRCNPKRSPKIREYRGTNMVTSLEMEVVGTVTHRHISLSASLGEYFSPFPLHCFISSLSCYVLVSCS